MRVAVFTDADFDRASSVTTMLGALLHHAPADVRPRIYTLSDLEIDEPGYLALRSPAITMPAGMSPMRLPRLRELERRLRSDDAGAIHVTTPGAAGVAARLLSYRTGLPLVGSLHRSALPTAGGRIVAAAARRYLHWLYGGCAKVLVPSSDAAHRLARAGWTTDRLAVWPGAVDAEAFSPARRSQRLRSAWHVSDRRPAILFVGPLTRERGVELIEPLGSLLHRRGIAHRFIVVGEGPALQGLADRCPDAVLAGRLSHRDLATVMASADVLLRTGDATAGLVLLEAQASGVPVLVTDGSARSHMRPGVTGLVCDPGDVLGLAARASELLTDGGGRRVMGDAARRFAQSRSWPTSLDRVYAIYRAASARAVRAGQ
jgi:phosphatidylinositol alpha 1,6-mannosyltransferase